MAVEVGAKMTGKVTGITNFGAFVDLGEHQTGLVHISEVSSGYVKDIHDVLAVGDEVTVKVTALKDGKIGLSIRQASEQATPERQAPVERSPRPARSGSGHGNGNRSNNRKNAVPLEGFDALMSGFLKESEDRLSSLRRNTEGKRGGRGGRRS